MSNRESLKALLVASKHLLTQGSTNGLASIGPSQVLLQNWNNCAEDRNLGCVLRKWCYFFTCLDPSVCKVQERNGRLIAAEDPVNSWVLSWKSLRLSVMLEVDICPRKIRGESHDYSTPAQPLDQYTPRRRTSDNKRGLHFPFHLNRIVFTYTSP
ncbi:hypothetical protein OG21DRAFT_1514106 [Imleria badia]|nr:hypothetical protein OG21DRAFT_1514106 [Imleria badia]